MTEIKIPKDLHEEEEEDEVLDFSYMNIDSEIYNNNEEKSIFSSSDVIKSMESCSLKDHHPDNENNKNDDSMENFSSYKEIVYNTLKEMADNIEFIISEIDTLKTTVATSPPSPTATVTIDDITTFSDSITKRRKITYEEEEEEKEEKEKISSFKKILRPSYYSNLLRIITNCDTNNYGKLIGKNGKNINYLQNLYDVTIIVPSSKDLKNFKDIIVLNIPPQITNNYEMGKLDEVSKHILKLLSGENTYNEFW